MENLFALINSFWNALQNGQLLHLGEWSYVFFALIVMVEGPIATLLGAAAASASTLSLPAVFVAAFVGNLAADLLWYSLGYFGKLDWALRIGKYFGMRQNHLSQLQQGCEAQLPKLLIVAKFTAAFTIPTLVAAGLAKLAFKRWLPAYVFAEVAWTGLLVLIGYFITDAAQRVESNANGLAIASFAIFLTIAFFLFRRWLQVQSKKAQGYPKE
ncbi:MAG: DedA family protein [Chloroflexota bacterium]